MEDKTTESPERKDYAPPQLIVYGDAEELTGASGGTPTDGVTGSVVVSDRNAKEHMAAVDGREILERLSAVPVQTWNYKGQDPAVRHMGPMAQDFMAAFGVGEDDRHINLLDANGVALAGIQVLYRMLQEKDTEIQSLRAEVAALKGAYGAPRLIVHGDARELTQLLELRAAGPSFDSKLDF